MSNTGMTDQEIIEHLREAAADGWLHLLTGDLIFSQRYAISKAPERLEALKAENRVRQQNFEALQAENARLRDQLAAYTGITETMIFVPPTE